jgi:hypothetical protein
LEQQFDAELTCEKKCTAHPFFPAKPPGFLGVNDKVIVPPG